MEAQALGAYSPAGSHLAGKQASQLPLAWQPGMQQAGEHAEGQIAMPAAKLLKQKSEQQVEQEVVVAHARRKLVEARAARMEAEAAFRATASGLSGVP